MNYFKKQFGQNFLTSREYAKKLVKAADIGSNDIVLEVGAGAGMVTQYLVEKAHKVIAVEIDERFVKLMESRFKTDKIDRKLQIVDEDILKFKAEGYRLKAGGYKVIGSLPYNISKKIIRKFLEDECPPSDITVIIQKEVAEDYVANSPKATFLSNYVQIFGSAEFIEIVPKEVFKPVPKVDGGIVRFKIKDLRFKDFGKFAKFLKSSFLNPRKKLVNNLAGIYHLDKENMVELLVKLGINKNARASELKFRQWLKLFEIIKK